MGLIRKVASIMMLGGMSSHTGREPAGEGRMGPGEGREGPEESRGDPGSAGRG